MTTTKKVILAICFILGAIGLAQAQTEYRREGNTLIKVEKTKEKKEPTKTDLKTIIKGIEYPVYKGTKGAFYIIRTSKKTGKEYRQYIKIQA